MEFMETIRNVIDWIPKIISIIRDLITKLTETLNLPTDSSMLVFLMIALVLSYFWIRQFITYSLFTKVSTLLNWVLLALLIYVVFVYV